MIREIEQIISECVCDRCGYVWHARLKMPRLCASCKNINWNAGVKVKRQVRKQGRTAETSELINAGYKDIKVNQCKCGKCGYVWITKTERLPARCARCNLITWQEEKR